MRQHVRTLGLLNIVWGSIGLLGAFVVLLVFGGAAGILHVVGANEPDARFALPIVGLVGGFCFLVILLVSLPAVIAGIGLLQSASWARTLGIIVSALHILNVPFGTALGIYGLWVLLKDEREELTQFPTSRP